MFSMTRKRLVGISSALTMALVLVLMLTSMVSAGDGAMTNLDTLGRDYSFAQGINTRGQGVGDSYTTADLLHTFLWKPR